MDTSSNSSLNIRTCYDFDTEVKDVATLTLLPALVLCLTVVVYLSLVLVILPRFMANREPYKLKLFVHVYNTLQIFMNLYICYTIIDLMNYQIFNFWQNICNPVTVANGGCDLTIYSKAKKSALLYCWNKTLDLMDTIIFCLKKKQSQVTFLHVYHHAVLMLVSGITFFYFSVELSSVLLALNSFVHVIMYIYYFLSNLGPSMRKYLWWKSHLTKIQIIHFLIILTSLAKLLMEDCNQASYYAALWGFTVTSILLLFCDFYMKTYKKKFA